MEKKKLAEIEQVVKTLVNYLRNKYNIGIYSEDKNAKRIARVCEECKDELVKRWLNNEFGYEMLKIDFMEDENAFHYSNLVGFETEDIPKWYIVDPTYGQFFERKKFRDYMFNHHREFSEKILQQGYIECNISNINAFISGFLYSKAFKGKIDYDDAFLKIENLLNSNNIVNKEVRDNIAKFVELLKNKQELMIDFEKEEVVQKN